MAQGERISPERGGLRGAYLKPPRISKAYARSSEPLAWLVGVVYHPAASNNQCSLIVDASKDT
jgi:hypothetical protein